MVDFGPSHYLPLLLAKLHPCDLRSVGTEFLLRNWSPDFLWLPCWSINSLFVKRTRFSTQRFTNYFLCKYALLSCIYTVHLTRSRNRQTNTCTLLISLFI